MKKKQKGISSLLTRTNLRLKEPYARLYNHKLFTWNYNLSNGNVKKYTSCVNLIGKGDQEVLSVRTVYASRLVLQIIIPWNTFICSYVSRE